METGPFTVPGITINTAVEPSLEITIAGVLPTVKEFSGFRLLPVTVMSVPIGPEVGVKPEIEGDAGTTFTVSDPQLPGVTHPPSPLT